MFCSHGTDISREIWRFGEPGSQAYDALLKFDNLRYRLMPYIYSNAWKVTNEGYTMMHGLMMDFRHDYHVFDVDKPDKIIEYNGKKIVMIMKSLN